MEPFRLLSAFTAPWSTWIWEPLELCDGNHFQGNAVGTTDSLLHLLWPLCGVREHLVMLLYVTCLSTNAEYMHTVDISTPDVQLRSEAHCRGD